VSDSAIEIDKVTKDFDKFRAVDSVSFEVPERSTFGLLGPNGAGKTTLFSLVASFLHPTSGVVRVEGIDVRNISEMRGRLSILPQDAQFAANIPILEQVIFLASLGDRTRHEAEKEANKALALVGLEDKAKRGARVLSHGMSKRLGIAQAFLGNPSVILLDEPTAGLHPKSAQGIRDLIKEHRTSGTLVVSSHDLGEVQRMCDRVAILKEGKLVSCADVSELTQSHGTVRMTFTRELTKEEQEPIRKLEGVTSFQHDKENSYLLALDAEEEREPVIARAAQALAAAGIVARSIEDGGLLETKYLELTD
jgi:ABC-type multidrug transport system ATPase subunit